MKKVWKYLRFILQLLISAGVLYWLVSHLGLSNVANSFKKLTWQLLLSCAGLYVIAQTLSAWRWWRMANILRFDVSLGRCINLYFLGMFYNVFLPSGYGGDLVKLFYMARHHRPPSKRLSALSIFLDRFTGLIAILSLGCLSSLAMGIKEEVLGNVMAIALVFILALGIFAVLLVARLKVIPRRVRVVALILYNHAPKFVSIIIASLVVQLLNVWMYVLIFNQLGLEISLAGVTFGYALVTLATLIPVSVGGLGIRESSWVGILKLYGMPVHAGISAGILFFLVQTLVGMGGLYSFFKARFRISEEEEDDAHRKYDV